MRKFQSINQSIKYQQLQGTENKYKYKMQKQKMWIGTETTHTPYTIYGEVVFSLPHQTLHANVNNRMVAEKIFGDTGNLTSSALSSCACLASTYRVIVGVLMAHRYDGNLHRGKAGRRRACGQSWETVASRLHKASDGRRRHQKCSGVPGHKSGSECG